MKGYQKESGTGDTAILDMSHVVGSKAAHVQPQVRQGDLLLQWRTVFIGGDVHHDSQAQEQAKDDIAVQTGYEQIVELKDLI